MTPKKEEPENGKSRIKERTIHDVISAVSCWRLLYTGYTKNGIFVKMTLEEAAQKVQISKKSLDDYLMQLRSAKKFGFDFSAHYEEKVGVIRSFVRKHKEDERKRLAIQKGTSSTCEKSKKHGGGKADPTPASSENKKASTREDAPQKRAPMEKKTLRSDFKVKAKAVSLAKK